jgi:hypothetical protein
MSAEAAKHCILGLIHNCIFMCIVQCCRFGMFIPDPGLDFSIPDPGLEFSIPDSGYRIRNSELTKNLSIFNRAFG